jgi:hypothetical protein
MSAEQSKYAIDGTGTSLVPGTLEFTPAVWPARPNRQTMLVNEEKKT